MDKKKVLIGKVNRLVGNRSAIVIVSSAKAHPRYKKVVKRTKSYMVENKLEAGVGDLVKIVETRPLSATRHFTVKEVLGNK